MRRPPPGGAGGARRRRAAGRLSTHRGRRMASRRRAQHGVATRPSAPRSPRGTANIAAGGGFFLVGFPLCFCVRDSFQFGVCCRVSAVKIRLLFDVARLMDTATLPHSRTSSRMLSCITRGIAGIATDKAGRNVAIPFDAISQVRFQPSARVRRVRTSQPIPARFGGRSGRAASRRQAAGTAPDPLAGRAQCAYTVKRNRDDRQAMSAKHEKGPKVVPCAALRAQTARKVLEG